MTEERLQELEKLCAEATPGPWSHIPDHDSCPDGYNSAISDQYGHVVAERMSPEDALFFIAVRTALPEALEEIRRLQASMHGYDHEWANRP